MGFCDVPGELLVRVQADVASRTARTAAATSRSAIREVDWVELDMQKGTGTSLRRKKSVFPAATQNLLSTPDASNVFARWSLGSQRGKWHEEPK